MDQPITHWVVYRNPVTRPLLYVVRKWVVEGSELRATSEAYTGVTLQEVRDRIPYGFHCMPRQPGDDHTIVECWI